MLLYLCICIFCIGREAEGSREGEFYMIFTLTHSQIHNTRYTGVQHTQPTDTLLETGELEQIVSKFSQNEVT